MRGLVERVEVVPVRTFLLEPVEAGATELVVDDGTRLAVLGAQAVVDDLPYDVLTVTPGGGEDDPDVVLLATALTAGLEAGEPVGILPAVEYTLARVVLAEPLGVLDDVTVDQGLQGKVDLQAGVYEGADRPAVDVEQFDGEWFIVGVDGRGADDGSYLGPGTITETEIADDSISTPKMRANAVTADKVAADVLVVNNVYSREGVHIQDASGATLDLTPGMGLKMVAPSGRTVFEVPLTPDEEDRIFALLRANLEALSITVLDFFALRGANNVLEQGAVLTLAAGIGRPSQAPSVSAGWPSRQFATDTITPRGWARHGDAWWYTQTLFGGNVMKVPDDTGVPELQWTYPNGTTAYQDPLGGIAFAGGKAYVLVKDSGRRVGSLKLPTWWVMRHDPVTGAKEAEWQYQPAGETTGLYSESTPAIGARENDLIIAQPRKSDGRVEIRHYTLAGVERTTSSVAKVLTSVSTSGDVTAVTYTGIGDDPVGLVYTLTTTQTPRAYVVRRSVPANGSAARVVAQEFPLPEAASGFGADMDDEGTAFFQSMTNGRAYRYSGYTWGAYAPRREWAGYTWWDPNTDGDGQHESLVSETTSVDVWPRQTVTVSTSPLPPRNDPPSPDDATAVRIYRALGQSKPGSADLRRGGGDVAEGITIVDFTTSPAASNPPNTGTPPAFPARAPALLQSADGVVQIWGDGRSKVPDPELPEAIASKRYVDGEPWHLVGAVGEPPFRNDWINYGAPFQPTAFRRVGKRVHLRGMVDLGAANSTIFELPPGYRPTAQTMATARAQDLSIGSNLPCRLNIHVDGSVSTSVPVQSGWVNLDDASFFLD